MIRLCPYCGRSIGEPLVSGLATCENCNQTFNTSDFHKALSAAWVVRRWRVEDRYTLAEKFEFPPHIVDLVEEHVINQMMTHDEFYFLLDKYNCLDKIV